MKCRYCDKETNKEYCSFDCRKAFFDFYDDVDKYKKNIKKYYVGAILFSIPFMILFLGAGVTVLLMVTGIITYCLPFPSEKLKKRYPLKDAVNKVRVNGILLFLAGLPFLLLTYTPFF